VGAEVRPETYDLIGWVAREGEIQIGRAPDSGPFDHVYRLALACLCAALAGRQVAPRWLSIGQIPFQSTVVACHENGAGLLGHCCQPFTDGVT
jgi:hypothetical protein